ncbi:hypothetical protein ACHAWT_009013 [Skeletonema menzelii]|mmetsp:Transcript_23413/g.38594  ORF Transcript_23413/g.38594 Transcript_23413/m.38594 type:complete len:208 (+) Transcript_23413:20-643(+)
MFKQRMMLFLTLLVLAVAVSTSVAALEVSENWCLERGFDPANLSCDTCRLIDESTTIQKLQRQQNLNIGEECRQCCQFHKVNPVLHPDYSLRGKFKYALLTYNEGSLGQEIKDFLERDLSDVLSFKGENRFKAVASTKSSMDSEMMMQMMMMGIMSGGSGPKLMLFDKHKKGGWSEEDEKEAVEVIKLRGWKREDLKDMLMTLLPSA